MDSGFCGAGSMLLVEVLASLLRWCASGSFNGDLLLGRSATATVFAGTVNSLFDDQSLRCYCACLRSFSLRSCVAVVGSCRSGSMLGRISSLCFFGGVCPMSRNASSVMCSLFWCFGAGAPLLRLLQLRGFGDCVQVGQQLR